MPIVQLKISSKLISSLMVMFLIAIPNTSSAHDIPKPSFSLGIMQISDNAFNALAGTGVTIDDNDTVANFTVDYYVSPGLAFEGGVITSPEVSASLPSNDSGTLHGKSYSTSGALTLTAKTDTSYLFGVKYSSPGPLSVYGKAGMLFWNVNYIATASGTITYAGSSYSGSSSLTLKYALLYPYNVPSITMPSGSSITAVKLGPVIKFHP